MKEIGNQPGESEIKRYLYGEMPDEERAALEDKFFENDGIFYEISNAENELVGAYARGEIKGAELARFERALENQPQWRAKIANAVALQTFIDEERRQATTASAAETKQTFRQRLANLFSMKTPAFGYAMTALFLIFALASVLLFLDNRNKSGELAQLQNNEKQIELERELQGARAREIELKNQIDGERAASGDLTDELERERQRREQIEGDLEKLRRENSARPTPTAHEQTPIVASIFLSGVGTRGGGTISQNFTIERGTKRIAVRLALPDETIKDARFSVALNDKIVARDIAVLISPGGQKAIQLTVSPDDLLDGANRLSVRDAAGAEVAKFVFNMLKK